MKVGLHYWRRPQPDADFRLNGFLIFPRVASTYFPDAARFSKADRLSLSSSMTRFGKDCRSRAES